MGYFRSVFFLDWFSLRCSLQSKERPLRRAGCFVWIWNGSPRLINMQSFIKKSLNIWSGAEDWEAISPVNPIPVRPVHKAMKGAVSSRLKNYPTVSANKKANLVFPASCSFYSCFKLKSIYLAWLYSVVRQTGACRVQWISTPNNKELQWQLFTTEPLTPT